MLQKKRRIEHDFFYILPMYVGNIETLIVKGEEISMEANVGINLDSLLLLEFVNPQGPLWFCLISLFYYCMATASHSSNFVKD